MKQFFLKFKTIKLLDFALIGIIVILGVSIATIISMASILTSTKLEVGGKGYFTDTLYLGAGVTAPPSGYGLIVDKGNVGIGTTDPGTNKLQVNGKIQAIGGDICTDQGGGKCLSAAGGGSLSCTTATCSTGSSACTATCPAGFTATGGGVNVGETTLGAFSFPSGNTGWTCANANANSSLTCYARCCKIQ